MLGCRRWLWISTSRRSWCSTLECCSCVCRAKRGGSERVSHTRVAPPRSRAARRAAATAPRLEEHFERDDVFGLPLPRQIHVPELAAAQRLADVEVGERPLPLGRGGVGRACGALGRGCRGPRRSARAVAGRRRRLRGRTRGVRLGVGGAQRLALVVWRGHPLSRCFEARLRAATETSVVSQPRAQRGSAGRAASWRRQVALS